MAIEKAIISYVAPHLRIAKLKARIEDEIRKGCSPMISSAPLALEPFFIPLWPEQDLPDNPTHQEIIEPAASLEELARFKVWISPEQGFDFNISERFLKQLNYSSNRIRFEIVGNNRGITISFITHHDDMHILASAFRGEFEFCELEKLGDDILGGVPRPFWENIIFHDYFPSPPYSHLLSRPSELLETPFKSLFTSMSLIEAPSSGIYQVVFQPVSPRHNWHLNIQTLLDIQYGMKIQNNIYYPLNRYAQQSPSGELHHAANDLESKAHNDKPIFAVSVRTAVLSPQKTEIHHLESISVFLNLFL